MKIQNIVLVLVIVFLSNSIIAQDSTKVGTTFLPNKIYLPCNSCFTINNASVSMNNLKTYLQNTPEALNLFYKSKKIESVGQTLMLVGLFSLIGSAVTTNNDNHLSGKLAIGSLITFITGGSLVNASHKKLNRAICVYNSTH